MRVPIETCVAEDGVLRFKENTLVTMLADNFKYEGMTGLNALSLYYQVNNIPVEEYSQITQLIGYSVSGWGGLSTTSDEEYYAVQDRVENCGN